ncbi:hypothetical protein C8Q80DRAFT_863128 [Daedaleopsis nitida]|nr:hypothetical protein C8Q80DRAFT_863128 [Daedaleopsis nitida]
MQISVDSRHGARLPPCAHQASQHHCTSSVVGRPMQCADTFGKLIHKLVCAAASYSGRCSVSSTCPRGCPLPTIHTQFRCSTCGYMMT